MKDCLLIIEDEPLIGDELQRYFTNHGWEVVFLKTIADARQQLSSQSIDPIVILSDMNLPDGNGLSFLEEMSSQFRQGVEWIFLTGFGTIADSVSALRLGAFDFIEKPCDLNRLNFHVQGAARSAKAQRRLLIESQSSHHKYSVQSLLGTSDSSKRLREMISTISSVPFSSLILKGETGTGKGLVAKAIHYQSDRALESLVEINCAALPSELLEAELFGFEAGAFTNASKRHRGLFEQAHKGTLFLDEIGEMELSLQSKLLKAVEDLKIRRLGSEKEIEIDARIIAASNRNLQQLTTEGTFREDLFHRLSVLSIDIPPLRDRLEDLNVLVPAFIAEYNAKSGKQVEPEPMHQILEQLKAYHWPGNIRELRNVIERCVLLSDGQQFPLQWLQLPHTVSQQFDQEQLDQPHINIPLDGSISLMDMEKHILQKTLEITGNNVTAAARLLSSTREALRYKVQKHHLLVECQSKLHRIKG